MAFRYILKSGDVIEADTAGEIQQLSNLLNQKPQHKGAFILGVSAMLEALLLSFYLAKDNSSNHLYLELTNCFILLLIFFKIAITIKLVKLNLRKIDGFPIHIKIW